MRDPRAVKAVIPSLLVFQVLCQAPARAQEAAQPSTATAGPLAPVSASSKAAQRKPVKHAKAPDHSRANAKTSIGKTSIGKTSLAKTAAHKSSTDKTAIDTKDLTNPAASTEPTPQLKHGSTAKESPISVNARWSATNAPYYGLNSTTTQNDILRRDQGEQTSTPIDQVGVGLNLKF